MIFKKIFNELVFVAESNNLHCVLLLGSTARNEESYLIYNGYQIALSDIELIVVGSRECEKKVRREISEIEYKWSSLGSYFSIDVDYLPMWRIFTLKNRLLYNEAFYHQNYIYKRSWMPISYVLSKKFDYNEMSQTLIWRVFKARYTDLGGIFNPCLIKYIRSYNYARNILDMLTVASYSQGYHFKSYTERNENVNTIVCEKKFPNVDTKRIADVFKKAYIIKFNRDLNYNVYCNIDEFIITFNYAMYVNKNAGIRILPSRFQLVKIILALRNWKSLGIFKFIFFNRYYNHILYHDLLGLAANIKSTESSSFSSFISRYSVVLPYLERFRVEIY